MRFPKQRNGLERAWKIIMYVTIVCLFSNQVHWVEIHIRIHNQVRKILYYTFQFISDKCLHFACGLYLCGSDDCCECAFHPV
jgi:hypothetical protein